MFDTQVSKNLCKIVLSKVEGYSKVFKDLEDILGNE